MFFVNLPVCVIALIAGDRVLAESREANPGPFPDLVGSGVLALGVGADPQRDVVGGDGALEPVVRLAVRVGAGGRQQVDAVDGAPAQGERDLAAERAGTVVLRAAHDVGQHDAAHRAERHALRGRGGDLLEAGALVGVVVGVGDDEPAGRQRQHGDVPADDIVVEGRLLVHQVRHHLLVPERGPHDVGDEGRVVARPLDGTREVVGQGHGGGRGTVRGGGTHGPILP